MDSARDLIPGSGQGWFEQYGNLGVCMAMSRVLAQKGFKGGGMVDI